MATITMKALLETGVHFGHRARKWNPKMKPYIFTERNGIHILDLQQTLKAVKDVYDLVRDTVSEGGTLLFVGTKRQAQETIATEAARCNMPYVNERWLGGTLTNWRTIRQRIDYLNQLEGRRDRGEFELITKKEALVLSRKIEKLSIRLGGIRDMKSLPALLFVVDVRREHTAVREANILDIPVVAMVDTNCDPDLIDYIIPANDDAIRAIKLIASVMADACLEGMALRKEEEVEMGLPTAEYDYEQPAAEEEGEVSDEDFLGEATLAKLKSGELSFEEEKSARVKQAKAKAQAAEETEDVIDEEEEAVAEVEEAVAEAEEVVAEAEEAEAVDAEAEVVDAEVEDVAAADEE